MKKTLLFLVLVLGMTSFNVSAQTKKQSTFKRSTSARSANPQQGGQVMKFRQVGKDGYIWYKLKRGNLFGVRDLEGNNIIPIKYNSVSYYCDDISGLHCFYVKKGDFEGAYTRQGTLVVSPERHYVKVKISGHGGKICWIAEKNGRPEKYVLDARGKDIFLLNYESVFMSASFDYRGRYTSLGYFKILDGKREGICDLNGKLFVPLQNKSLMMDNYGKRLHKYDWDNEKMESSNDTEETINYDGSTQYDYTPYEDLYYAFKEKRSSSSGSSSSSNSSSSNSSSTNSSSSSSSSSSNSSSGSKTTTVVVEHHRDPVPVQEWVQCTVCWGSGTCPDCSGSGTKYIGDNLHRCWRCGGRGKCSACSGQGGRYYTVYR